MLQVSLPWLFCAAEKPVMVAEVTEKGGLVFGSLTLSAMWNGETGQLLRQ